MARELVEYFGLDRIDWSHVLMQAKRLVRRRDFRRLVVRIADELEPVEVLDADDLRSLMEPGGGGRVRGVELEYRAVEATAPVEQELGMFTALAATNDVDRVQDRIRFGAFENTIARWRASGKRCRSIGRTAARPTT